MSTPFADADSGADSSTDSAPDADVECGLCGCDVPEGMVCIPEGPFLGGSEDYLPIREFYISTFLIDRHETTNEEYRRCVEAGSCYEGALYSLTRPDYLNNPEYDRYPVVHRVWQRAYDFCRWADKRLPTEAEWEKAARGGCEVLGEDETCELETDAPAHPWGNAEVTCDLANEVIDCVGDTAEVGSYPGGASPYGVMDMQGNVTEWINDWYTLLYRFDAPSRDPQGATEEESIGSCEHNPDLPCHVQKSISFHMLPHDYETNIAIRFGGGLGLATYATGFRCAQDVSSPSE